MRGILSRLGVALLSLIACLLAVEGIARLVGFDFEHQVHALGAVPIYYLRPMEPLAPVFFRRRGPAEWSGQVLHTREKQVLGENSRFYADEQPVTVRYDADGFRNPDDLEDWEVVVVGDSFTELGFLPYDELFTTRLGELLGVRVRNLGVSYTGVLAYVAYLEAFGEAPSTRDAVLVFFEGNDVDDTLREHEDLERARATGRRELREVEPQDSPLKALRKLLERRQEREASEGGATYTAGDEPCPVTVGYLPPSLADLADGDAAVIEDALRAWGEAARARGMRPWLVYMPCKRRVLDGHLAFGAGVREAVRDWQPSALPTDLRELTARLEIGFVDATPALASAAARGVLPYNGVFDSHLNREGSRIVAEVIADALGAASTR